jgi:hypothetical protein
MIFQSLAQSLDNKIHSVAFPDGLRYNATSTGLKFVDQQLWCDVFMTFRRIARSDVMKEIQESALIEPWKPKV